MDAIRRPRAGCPPNWTSYQFFNPPKVVHFIKLENKDKDDTYTEYLIVEEKPDEDTC
jgi:hypothetical protein